MNRVSVLACLPLNFVNYGSEFFINCQLLSGHGAISLTSNVLSVS